MGSGTPGGRELDVPCFCDTPLEARAVPGRDAVESFGIDNRDNEDDRGLIPGRLEGGLGERWEGLRE